MSGIIIVIVTAPVMSVSWISLWLLVTRVRPSTWDYSHQCSAALTRSTGLGCVTTVPDKYWPYCDYCGEFLTLARLFERFKIYFIQLYKCCYYKVLNINTQTKLKPKTITNFMFPLSWDLLVIEFCVECLSLISSCPRKKLQMRFLLRLFRSQIQ